MKAYAKIGKITVTDGKKYDYVNEPERLIEILGTAPIDNEVEDLDCCSFGNVIAFKHDTDYYKVLIGGTEMVLYKRLPLIKMNNEYGISWEDATVRRPTWPYSVRTFFGVLRQGAFKWTMIYTVGSDSCVIKMRYDHKDYPIAELCGKRIEEGATDERIYEACKEMYREFMETMIDEYKMVSQNLSKIK